MALRVRALWEPGKRSGWGFSGRFAYERRAPSSWLLSRKLARARRSSFPVVRVSTIQIRESGSYSSVAVALEQAGGPKLVCHFYQYVQTSPQSPLASPRAEARLPAGHL